MPKLHRAKEATESTGGDGSMEQKAVAMQLELA